MYDTPTPTIHDLADQAVRFTHTLAGLPANGAQTEWKRSTLAALAKHPDVTFRRHLAVRASLATLRHLVTDADESVRRACAFNGFAIDVDIQIALAGDSACSVVLALLRNVDICADAADQIVAGPHRRAKVALAAKRNLPQDLRARLAAELSRNGRRVTVNRAAVANLRAVS